MFNSEDIYLHLLEGGDKQVLFDALMQEIIKAEEKIKAKKEAEKKEQELADKKNKARTAAFKTLKSYFALVNPDVTEDIINSVLDTLESVEIKINGVRDKCDNVGYLSCATDIAKADIDAAIAKVFFPFLR